jgi:hypothetical protein
MLKEEENVLPKVKSFLEGIGRNSKKSKNSYHSGIKHFQQFLDVKYPGKETKRVMNQYLG